MLCLAHKESLRAGSIKTEYLLVLFIFFFQISSRTCWTTIAFAETSLVGDGVGVGVGVGVELGLATGLGLGDKLGVAMGDGVEVVSGFGAA
jgi:hypothetical protein